MNEGIFQKNRLLNDLTTFGIGGPAHLLCEVQTFEEMQLILRYCHKNQLRFIIIGKGSNTLFDDRGFDGVVIVNRISFFERPTPDQFHVGAGYSFSLLGTQTARLGYAGLEFASGIPGSVGGAIFMNAGANGQETCESLHSVEFLTPEGTIMHLQREELLFSYRTSSFQSMQGAIVGATFQLKPSLKARQKQLEIIQYRKETQPYSEMSAGCVFRNPPNTPAGALIDQSGLKGTVVGGAQVSPLHANFIINTGKATAQDVLSLMASVKHQVKEKTGVDLESEIRYIPYREESST